MSTKAQLYAQLTASNSLEQSIINDCQSLKDLKSEQKESASTEIFIKHHLVHYDRDTLMNTESGVLYDKITNKIVGIHNT